MPKTIIQKIQFKNTSPAALYELYMNQQLHALVTDSEVVMNETIGADYTAYNEYITGKNLQLERNRLIVQSWRATDWEEHDADSTFILLFEPNGQHTNMYMTHANVPDNQYEDLDKGWHDNYWDLWKAYLDTKK